MALLFLIGCTENTIQTSFSPQENKVVDAQKTTFNKESTKTSDIQNQKDRIESQEANCRSMGNFFQVTNCYISLAIAENNQSICYKLEKELAIKDCLTGVIPELGSAELCKKLSDENDRMICFAHVGSNGKDLDGCNNLPDNDFEAISKGGTKFKIKKKDCFKGYYSSIMDKQFEKLDKSICNYWDDRSIGKEECLEKLAKLKEDYTYCQGIVCVIDIAKSKKDPSLCDGIKELFKDSLDEEIIECKDNVAIDELNPDDCETPSCISRIAMELGDMTICFKGCKAWSYERLITGSGIVGFDSEGNTVGYDRKFTVDDCNKMKEKCSDCDVELYDACLIRAFRRDPNLKEQDCDIISNSNIKKACIYETYNR